MSAPDGHDETYYANYGRVISGWVDIEYILGLWFNHLSNINQSTGHDLFHSMRSLGACKDLLQAAFKSYKRDEELTRFFNKAMTLVDKYSQARNKLAHHQTLYIVPEQKLVLAHKNDPFRRKPVLTFEEFKNAISNFKSFADVLIYALPTSGPHKPLGFQDARSILDQLPIDAFAKGPDALPMIRKFTSE
jgi:hypothetical protein